MKISVPSASPPVIAATRCLTLQFRECLHAASDADALRLFRADCLRLSVASTLRTRVAL